MKFQMESSILSKSDRSFVLDGLTFLFKIYLAMKFKESLILFASEAICSIELYKDIRWKLPLQRSGSVGEFGS